MTYTKQSAMDIAMNLNRIGNWIADDYISNLEIHNDRFKPTWLNFIDVYPNFRSMPQDNAENLMTWGNILTHRAKLIEN